MEDADATLARAGIQEGGAQPRLKRVRGFTCEVCYTDETQETLALSCDHRCESFFASPGGSSVAAARADEARGPPSPIPRGCWSGK